MYVYFQMCIFFIFCRYVKYVVSWYGLLLSNGGMCGVDYGYEVFEYGWCGY